MSEATQGCAEHHGFHMAGCPHCVASAAARKERALVVKWLRDTGGNYLDAADAIENCEHLEAAGTPETPTPSETATEANQMMGKTSRLQEIRERLEAATAWPWVEDDGHIHSTPACREVDRYIRHLMEDEQFANDEGGDQPLRPHTMVATCEQAWPNFQDDADFIAHAPDDIAWLLEQVRTSETATEAKDDENENRD